jgi:DNA-binding SARP family transcriptional activator/DNA-binding HxlR family transcriptional regulator
MTSPPCGGDGDDQDESQDFIEALRSPDTSLGPIVDHWVLLILQEAMMRGTTRFDDFQRCLATSPEVLATRLEALVEAKLMECVPSPQGQLENAYLLTEIGRDLESAIIALTIWDIRWTARENSTPLLILQDARAAPPSSADEVEHPLVVDVNLLGTFSVRIGAVLLESLSVGSQRLLAFLALQDRTVARIALAGAMWPEATDRAAGMSLRSALSRLDPRTRGAILTGAGAVRLADAVVVDYRVAQALARRLLRPTADPSNGDLSREATTMLSTELLPDWYDDWVVAEAEDWRQLRVNALEALAGHLIEAGRLAEAAGAARAAMRVDPLRESAHARLIEVHLAEGNQSEALRVFERYRVLLYNELKLEPTPRIANLVARLRRS